MLSLEPTRACVRVVIPEAVEAEPPPLTAMLPDPLVEGLVTHAPVYPPEPLGKSVLFSSMMLLGFAFW